MKILSNILLVTFLSIGLISCYDNIDNSIDLASNVKDTPIIINTSITGSVWSEDNLTTDYNLLVNGYATIVNTPQEIFFTEIQNVNKKGQAIYIYKNGLLAAMSHTQLIENDINYLNIELFTPYSLATPNNSNPFVIHSNITGAVDDSKITNQNGNTVSDIEVLHRDLSLLRDKNQLGVAGYDLSGELQILNHQNVVELRINSLQGDNLDLTEAIILNINNNSDEGQLYHFDEQDEQWQFAARLKNGSNRIVLNNDGFYSVCNAQQGLYSEGIVTHDEVGVSYQMIQCDYSNGQQNTITTLSGIWINIVPSQSEVNYTLSTPCADNEIVYNLMTADAHIDNQIIVDVRDNYVSFQPEVYQCNGEKNMQQALIVSQVNTSQYYPMYAGDRANISVCAESFEVTGYDIHTGAEGIKLPWNKEIDIDMLELLTCSEFNNGYSYIKIGNDKKILDPFTVDINDDTVLKSSDEQIRFKFKGNSVGMYEQDQVNLYFYDETFGDKGYFMSCENSEIGCGFDEWNVTHFNAGAEKWVRISFAGSVWIQTLSPAEAGYFDMEGVILCQAQ